MNCKSLWHINPQKSQLRTSILKSPKDQSVYPSVYSLISTGTERLIATGQIGEDFEEYMRVPHQEGAFSLPVKYGYSLVVKDRSGRTGHLMHPHQDLICVPKEEIYWSSKIPAKRLALISNIETTINAMWDAGLVGGERVGICGFGNIGSLLALTLRDRLDIEAEIIEIDEWRKEKALEMGFYPDSGKNYDVIFHTTATSGGLQYCIDHLRQEGKIIELSWYGHKSTVVSLGRDFHYKRQKIISSQVSVIPPKMQSTFDYKKRKDLALEILQNDDFDRLITGVIAFEDLPYFFDRLRKGEKMNGLIWLVRY